MLARTIPSPLTTVMIHLRNTLADTYMDTTDIHSGTSEGICFTDTCIDTHIDTYIDTYIEKYANTYIDTHEDSYIDTFESVYY